MSENLPSFQRYQLAFTNHLRDPLYQPLPVGVPPERMAVYEEIVFNNLFESVSACFPVARKVVGKRKWLLLTRAFMRDYSADSPLFRKIPEQFLQFLQHAEPELQQLMPPYLYELCHYEWIELLVAAIPERSLQHIEPDGSLLSARPAFSATMQLLDYHYPVHKISPRNKPRQQESTQLLVYRNADDQINFVELNTVTHRLISILQQGTSSGKQALTLIAKELQHPQPESIIEFGLSVLEDLKHRGVIIGTYR